MQRRLLVQYLGIFPLATASFTLLSCGRDSTKANLKSRDERFKFRDESEDNNLLPFAYFQGLRANQEWNPRDTEGTFFRMPCILWEDVTEGVEKEYPFWHGHGGIDHSFIISEREFSQLNAGESIIVYTDIVAGHRHPIRVSLQDLCADNKVCD